jgi:glyoxylase-like metal-dependent hydrolase (beta-lactamase superfamily II)
MAVVTLAPIYGDLIVDTGVLSQLNAVPAIAKMASCLVSQFGFDRIELNQSTEHVLKSINEPLKGVFLTHLHLEHISELPAIDPQVPIYVGVGETE